MDMNRIDMRLGNSLNKQCKKHPTAHYKPTTFIKLNNNYHSRSYTIKASNFNGTDTKAVKNYLSYYFSMLFDESRSRTGLYLRHIAEK